MLSSFKVYFSLSWILLSPSNQNSMLDGFKFQPDQWSGLGTLSLSLNFFLKLSKEFKQEYNDEKNVPRPNHWSGWNLTPASIEFWLDGDNRIHERLKYTIDDNGNWIKSLLSP